MKTIAEQTLKFVFPDGWQAVKWDDTSFYRNHFQGFADSKSVDIVAFSPSSSELWLIEVKDYRNHRRSKREDIFDEIAKKVRDTLACLCLAKSKPEIEVHEFAQQAVTKPNIRVVLHMEQIKLPFRQHSPVVKRDNARLKLKQAVKVVDPHALFCEMSSIHPSCPWQVLEP